MGGLFEETARAIHNLRKRIFDFGEALRERENLAYLQASISFKLDMQRSEDGLAHKLGLALIEDKGVYGISRELNPINNGTFVRAGKLLIPKHSKTLATIMFAEYGDERFVSYEQEGRLIWAYQDNVEDAIGAILSHKLVDGIEKTVLGTVFNDSERAAGSQNPQTYPTVSIDGFWRYFKGFEGFQQKGPDHYHTYGDRPGFMHADTQVIDLEQERQRRQANKR